MTELKQRVLAAVAAQPSPTRHATNRRRARLLAGAASLSLATWAMSGGIRPTGRPAELMLASALGALAVAAVALAGALSRGRSMLGRSPGALIIIAVACPLALLAWKAGVSAHFDGMTVPWPDRPGFRCLLVALASSVAPFASLLLVWRRTQPAHPRLTGLVLGTAAGAVGWLLVDLWCPVGHLEHLILGHLLPLAALAAVGAAAGRWLEAA